MQAHLPRKRWPLANFIQTRVVEIKRNGMHRAITLMVFRSALTPSGALLNADNLACGALVQTAFRRGQWSQRPGFAGFAQIVHCHQGPLVKGLGGGIDHVHGP